MNSATFKDGDMQYVRVNKTIARTAYDDGKPVVLCPVKLHPFGAFRPSVMVQKRQPDGHDFNTVVRDFEWYNCQLNETGKYAAYYIAEGELSMLTVKLRRNDDGSVTGTLPDGKSVTWGADLSIKPSGRTKRVTINCFQYLTEWV